MQNRLRVVQSSLSSFWSVICKLTDNRFHKFLEEFSIFAEVSNFTDEISISIRTQSRDKRSKQWRFLDHEIFLSLITDISSDLRSLKESMVEVDSFFRFDFWWSTSASLKSDSEQSFFAKSTASEIVAEKH